MMAARNADIIGGSHHKAMLGILYSCIYIYGRGAHKHYLSQCAVLVGLLVVKLINLHLLF